MPIKLSQREEAFCLAVLTEKNQSAAYRKAYRAGRMTSKTINEKASRLMAKDKIRARVAELRAPVAEQAQMKRREWLDRMTRCARFDPRLMFDHEGNPRQIDDMTEGEANAIDSLERIEQYDSNGEIRRSGYRIQFVDRLKALVSIGRALGYTKNHSSPATIGLSSSQSTIVIQPVTVPPAEPYQRVLSQPSFTAVSGSGAPPHR